jgi:anaerobic selenocysteine-containing dehydrogenase
MIQPSRFTPDQLITGKIPAPETGIRIEKTICSICSNNCGIDAYIRNGLIVKVDGTAENRFSHGTLCAKGAAMRQYIYHPDRLRTPLLKKGDRTGTDFEPISWETAFSIAAERLNKIKAETGPESVAFFVGFPKWMRSFVKRLAHGFGSPNFCTESSTCYFGTEIANRLNYGQMSFPDLQGTRCLLVWSSNPFHSSTPKVKGLLKKMADGMRVIEVGPLITPLTRHADLHLRIRPGTCGALALSMANVIIEEGLYDAPFVETYTEGFEAFRAYVGEYPPDKAAAITSVPAELILQAARLFAGSKPAAIMSGASPTVHHTNGVQNHRAITALIGLTGNFDREGGHYVAPWSYYHVSNGLETRDEAFEQVRPWGEMAPRIGADVHPVWNRMMAEAQSIHLPFQIRSRKPYPVRSVVGFGLNHRMWPGSDFMRDSLRQLDFLAVADLFMTDTARMADLIFPVCSTFERSQLKMYPGRFGIWTEPVIARIGESRSDIDVVIGLAKALGLADSLLEQGYRACVDWILEPSGLQVADLEKQPGGCHLTVGSMPPYQKYKTMGFPTPSGKMEFCSSILAEAGYDGLPVYNEPLHSPMATPEIAERFPLVLTTGSRLPMFFHSRTFRLPWTRELRPDPLVEIHPLDAAARKIGEGDTVSLSTPKGSITVKAKLTERVPVGTAAIYHDIPGADINELIFPDYRDPLSGYPGFKSLLCQISRVTEDP